MMANDTIIDMREEDEYKERNEIQSLDVKTKLQIRTISKQIQQAYSPIRKQHSMQSTIISPSLSPIKSPICPNNVFSKQNSKAQSLKTEEIIYENPFQDITREVLQELTGVLDLSLVETFELVVNTDTQSIEMIGSCLPNLYSLRFLKTSIITSVRNLGTSLQSLCLLYISQCGVKDLDGLGALTNLKELYAQYNKITDISPMTMHDEIQVVDLEGNAIVDAYQFEQLTCCTSLTSLNLSLNPVSKLPSYREILANFIPNLHMLDDQIVTQIERKRLDTDEIDKAMQSYSTQIGMSQQDDQYKLAANLKSNLADILNSETNFSPPRPLSHSGDSGSSLTHGSDIVFAGNVTTALRRHRNSNGSEHGSLQVKLTSNDSPEEVNGTMCNAIANKNLQLKDRRRVSITDLLDCAKALEFGRNSSGRASSTSSREDIFQELKKWQKEIKSLNSMGADVKESVSRKSHMHMGTKNSKMSEQIRPYTSAGELVRRDRGNEVFQNTFQWRRSKGIGKGNVEILIIEDGRNSSKENKLEGQSSRNELSPSQLRQREIEKKWGLESLTTKLSIRTTKTPISTTQDEFERDEDYSSSEETADLQNSSRTVKNQCKQSFFNVFESLKVLEQWQAEHDQMISNVNDQISKNLTPNQIETGIAVSEEDETLVAWLQGKDKVIREQMKSREGFRRLFRGIDRMRMEQILTLAYEDQLDKISRRLHVMAGNYQQDLR